MSDQRGADESIAAIDWADQVHAYHMICPGTKPVTGDFKQTPEHIDNLIQEWRKRFLGRSFIIAIETTKGPLIRKFFANV